MTSEERSLEITSIKGELITNTAKEVPRFGLVRMLGASSYPGDHVGGAGFVLSAPLWGKMPEDREATEMGHTSRWDAGSKPWALCMQHRCKDRAKKCMAAPGDLSWEKEAIPPHTPWELGSPRGALPFHVPTFPLKAEGDWQGTATRHLPEPPVPMGSASGWLTRDPNFSHPSWSSLHHLSLQPRPRGAQIEPIPTQGLGTGDTEGAGVGRDKDTVRCLQGAQPPPEPTAAPRCAASGHRASEGPAGLPLQRVDALISREIAGGAGNR